MKLFRRAATAAKPAATAGQQQQQQQAQNVGASSGQSCTDGPNAGLASASAACWQQQQQQQQTQKSHAGHSTVNLLASSTSAAAVAAACPSTTVAAVACGALRPVLTEVVSPGVSPPGSLRSSKADASCRLPQCSPVPLFGRPGTGVLTSDAACSSATALGGLERQTEPASLNGGTKGTQQDSSCAGPGALHGSCADIAHGLSGSCADTTDAAAVLTATFNSLSTPESDLVAQLQQLLLAKQLLQSAKDVALAAFDQDGFLQAAGQLQDEAQVVLLFEEHRGRALAAFQHHLSAQPQLPLLKCDVAAVSSEIQAGLSAAVTIALLSLRLQLAGTVAAVTADLGAAHAAAATAGMPASAQEGAPLQVAGMPAATATAAAEAAAIRQRLAAAEDRLATVARLAEARDAALCAFADAMRQLLLWQQPADVAERGCQAAMTATLDGFTRLARCISSATAAAHSGAQAPPQQCSTGAGSSSDEEASLRQVLHLWSGLVMAAAEQHSSDAQALEAARTQLEQQAAHILGLESAAAARAQDGVEADAQD